MDRPDTFSLEGMDVAVQETAAALTYTFTPRAPAPRSAFPVGRALLFVVLPVAMLGLVVHALDVTGANRPAWELALTATFCAQLVALLLFGLTSLWRGHGTPLTFTHTQVRHGDRRVCELAAVRGLRLFVFPEATRDGTPFAPREPDKLEAALSLVIGEEGRAHGLFGGFEPDALRGLADDIRRRLTAFRHNQGLTTALEPLSVVETIANDVEKLMHTMPTTGPVRRPAGLVLRTRGRARRGARRWSRGWSRPVGCLSPPDSPRRTSPDTPFWAGSTPRYSPST